MRLQGRLRAAVATDQLDRPSASWSTGSPVDGREAARGEMGLDVVRRGGVDLGRDGPAGHLDHRAGGHLEPGQVVLHGRDGAVDARPGHHGVTHGQRRHQCRMTAHLALARHDQHRGQQPAYDKDDDGAHGIPDGWLTTALVGQVDRSGTQVSPGFAPRKHAPPRSSPSHRPVTYGSPVGHPPRDGLGPDQAQIASISARSTSNRPSRMAARARPMRVRHQCRLWMVNRRAEVGSPTRSRCRRYARDQR